MPYPRISALLNNCALHALTPEITAHIHTIASQPQEQQNNLSAPHRYTYQRLKAHFQVFYNIEEAFTWRHFSLLLQHYNPFDAQILLAPVLRSLLEETMQAGDKQESIALMNASQDIPDDNNDEFIQTQTQLNETNGRYSSLTPEIVSLFLAAPLGISLRYCSHNIVHIINESHDDDSIIILHHEGGIDGANAGGHWERTPDVHDRIDYESENNAQLREIARLFAQDNIDCVNMGFELLKKHLLLSYSYLFHPPKDENNAFKQLQLAVQQRLKYQYNRHYVNHNLARQLLGPNVAEEALHSIGPVHERTEPHPSPYLAALVQQNLPDQHARRPGVSKPYLPEEYQIAIALLTPPVLQSEPGAIQLIQERPLWVLSAQELSNLQRIEHFLFDEGLSAEFYQLCEQKQIVDQLSDPFIELLLADEHFNTRASNALKTRAECLLLKRSMHRLLETLKGTVSPYVFMGLSQSSKINALNRLISQTQQASSLNDLKQHYNELIDVVTTQRTRFGCFFYISRQNDTNTRTAMRLSDELAKDEYADLRAALSLPSNTPLGLRMHMKQCLHQTATRAILNDAPPQQTPAQLQA